MTLQNAFYFIGIIFYLLSIILLVVMGIVLIKIKMRVEAFHRYVENKTSNLVQTAETAVGLGSALAHQTVRTVRKMTRKGR